MHVSACVWKVAKLRTAGYHDFMNGTEQNAYWIISAAVLVPTMYWAARDTAFAAFRSSILTLQTGVEKMSRSKFAMWRRDYRRAAAYKPKHKK
jgi:hypothetical protein